MPRPKHPAGYPQVFFDIVEKVSASAKPLVYQCDTKKAAEALRFKFYSFIKACERSKDESEHELGRAGKGLIFQVSENVLTISPRDHTVEAYDLEDALRDYDQSPQSLPQSPTGNPALGGSTGIREEALIAPKLNLVKREEIKTTSHDDVLENFLKEE